MYKTTLTLLSVPLLAIVDKIVWKAYNVSPLYPIKNPKFSLFMFTFSPDDVFSMLYLASF